MIVDGARESTPSCEPLREQTARQQLFVKTFNRIEFFCRTNGRVIAHFEACDWKKLHIVALASISSLTGPRIIVTKAL